MSAPTPESTRFARLTLAATCAAALLGVAAPAASADPLGVVTPLATFNTTTYPVAPSRVVDLHGAGYFTTSPHSGMAAGAALARTDGTPNGTTVVRTFGNGALSEPTVAGDSLFFSAPSPTDPRVTTLWASDGTAAGTVPVSPSAFGSGQLGSIIAASATALYVPIYATNADSTVSQIDEIDPTTRQVTPITLPYPASSVSGAIATDGSLYLAVASGNQASGPMSSLLHLSGTTATELTTPAPGAATAPVIAQDGTVYFAHSDADHGDEPWQSDGTIAGTHLAYDAAPGAAGSNPAFTVAGDAVYSGDLRFRGGTAAVVPALDGAGHRVAVGNALYFFSGGSVWRLDSDSTAAVQLAAAPAPSSGDAVLAAANGAAYFSAGDSQLWRTDGTAAGTAKLGDVPGQPSYKGDGGGTSIGSFGTAGGTTYFTGDYALWRVDGASITRIIPTAARTQAGVTLPAPSIRGRALFFSTDTAPGDDVGDAPEWSHPKLTTTDGTAAGTKVIATFPGGSTPSQPVRFGNRDAFVLTNGQAGTSSLWTTNGRSVSKVRISANLTTSATISGLVSDGKRLLFMLDPSPADGSYSSLVSYDGHRTRTLTTDVGDTTTNAATVGSVAVFTRGSETTTGNYELWRSDGTRHGTFQLHHAGSGAATTAIVSAGRFAYFAVGATSPQLWRTDGTSKGTVQLTNIAWTTGTPKITSLTAAPDGSLWFATAIDGGTAGNGIWRTTGTARHTKLVQTLSQDTQVGDIVAAGRSVAALAVSYTGAETLWKASGHQAHLLATLPSADTDVSAPATRSLTASGHSVFFAGPPNADGTRGVWTSDGTASGTHADAAATTAGLTNPTAFVAAGDRVGLIADGPTGDGVLFSAPLPAAAHGGW